MSHGGSWHITAEAGPSRCSQSHVGEPHLTCLKNGGAGWLLVVVLVMFVFVFLIVVFSWEPKGTVNH